MGSILEFTPTDQNGKHIPNVTVLESVTPSTTIQTPEPVTFPNGTVTDMVGRGTVSAQPLTHEQRTNLVAQILATPTPPRTQQLRLTIVSPSSGVYAVATQQRSYTNLDAQGRLQPFLYPGTRVLRNNFSLTVSPISVVRLPMVMCPRF